ncbi:MAG: Do family serine endopeptidase [Opitutaceae bacterium]|jgi:serine protease Do/serine protease DegQ|nr:Do family serine endopeptidase [Opitutaceae bacterium]
MKIRNILILLLAAAAGATFTFAIVANEESKTPQIKTDDAPLAKTPGGVITSYADVIEPVQKAVVSVYSSKTVHQQINPFNPFFRRFFGDRIPGGGGGGGGGEYKQEGLGSGVVATADGYILTNNHVVDGADELKVALSDGRELTARLIGADPKTDIAVIKIDATSLPAITFADSDKIRVGDIAFAIGNPLDVGQTVTQGIVSATGRNNLKILGNGDVYENFIQTDAAINQGNSGGALVDAEGRLIGINTAIMTPSRGNIGIGFAIPANLAAGIMRSLIETGDVQRGYLGVEGQDVTAEIADAAGLKKGTTGVIINDIPADSPAGKAGLRRNDVVTAVNERPVKSMRDLRLQIATLAPGTEVKITHLRGGKERTATVKLGALSDTGGDEILTGVRVEPLTEGSRRQLGIPGNLTGVIITTMAEDSPYNGRLVEGLLIVEINNQPVTDADSARKALRKGANQLLVYSRGYLVRLPVQVK